MSDPLFDRAFAALGHQYELLGELGRGGMSVVYRARDLRLNRPVAVKVLPPELAYDPAIRTRFTREAQTFAQLAHAHIVPIYDVGERDGLAFFVMALVNGGSLSTLLAREPKLPVDETRRLIREVADALEYAHVRGVIHRDIKPDNILLDGESGRAMVTDFGIARAVEAGTRLTITGNAVGTPTYMSPEQATGDRELDGRSDIYSLGVVAYQMLTGRVPFTAPTSLGLLFKHLNEAPRPIVELRPDAPSALCEIIERALMKTPEDRWPTAASMRDALATDEVPQPAWRSERREPVRYISPRPDRSPTDRARGARPDMRSGSPPRGIVVANAAGDGAADQLPSIPRDPHALPAYDGLTGEQRQDLRLWHGRTNLLDRISAARGYTFATVSMWMFSLGGVALAIEEGVPPLILAPIVPFYMSMKLNRRVQSLRDAGVRLRRLLLMPRARWVLPAPPSPAKPEQPDTGAPRELLDGAHGKTVRRALQDRATIREIYSALSKPDRALIPELTATVDALVERVKQLAEMLMRLDEGIDPAQLEQLEARITLAEGEAATPEGERRLAFLRRQRETLQELAQRRAELARQLENAGLAIGNLRLDLIRLRSSGVQSTLANVTSATQEARALSREIDAVLAAAAEVRRI